MLNEKFETWDMSQKDLSVLFWLKFRQKVIGRQLLPSELIELALFLEEFLEDAEGMDVVPQAVVSFKELDGMLEDELKLFGKDIIKAKLEEKITT